MTSTRAVAAEHVVRGDQDAVHPRPGRRVGGPRCHHEFGYTGPQAQNIDRHCGSGVAGQRRSSMPLDELGDGLEYDLGPGLAQLLLGEPAGQERRSSGHRTGARPRSPRWSRRPSRRAPRRPSPSPRRRDPGPAWCARRRRRWSSRRRARARRAGRGSGPPRRSSPSSPAPRHGRDPSGLDQPRALGSGSTSPISST